MSISSSLARDQLLLAHLIDPTLPDDGSLGDNNMKLFYKLSGGQCFEQPKLNGERCLAFPYGHSGWLLMSRSGQRIPFKSRILSQLSQLPERFRFPLDGELYIHGMPLKDIHSRVWRSKEPHPDEDSLTYNIFDVIVEAGVPQWRRFIIRDELESILAFSNMSQLHLVETQLLVLDRDLILSAFNTRISQGYEGSILRDYNLPYLWKRTPKMLKIKKWIERQATIVSVHPAIEKSSGMQKDEVGTITCKWSAFSSVETPLATFNFMSDRPINSTDTFNTILKFTRETKRALWEARDELIGCECTVRYQEYTDPLGDTPVSARIIHIFHKGFSNVY